MGGKFQKLPQWVISDRDECVNTSSLLVYTFYWSFVKYKADGLPFPCSLCIVPHLLITEKSLKNHNSYLWFLNSSLTLKPQQISSEHFSRGRSQTARVAEPMQVGPIATFTMKVGEEKSVSNRVTMEHLNVLQKCLWPEIVYGLYVVIPSSTALRVSSNLYFSSSRLHFCRLTHSGSKPNLMAFCLFCCRCLSFSSFIWLQKNDHHQINRLAADHGILSGRDIWKTPMEHGSIP